MHLLPLCSLPAKVRFGLMHRHASEHINLSQVALAEQAGVHPTYIGQVERGKRNIFVDNTGRLVNAIGMELSEMLHSN